MDFPKRLEDLLWKEAAESRPEDDDCNGNGCTAISYGDEEEEETNAAEKGTTLLLLTTLDRWNDEMETYLGAPPPPSSSSTTHNNIIITEEPLLLEDESSYSKQLLRSVSFLLLQSILNYCCCWPSSSSAPNNSNYDTIRSIMKTFEKDDDNDDVTAIKKELARIAQMIWLQQDGKQLQLPTINDDDTSSLTRLVRAGKNFLRWYIQIYLERRRQRQLPNDDSNGKDDDDSPVQMLQTPSMLGIMLRILTGSLSSASHAVVEQQETTTTTTSDCSSLARYASLYLFYATYSSTGHPQHDTVAQTGLKHLVEEWSFPQVAMELLCQRRRRPTMDIPTALSLVRNLHNMAMSLPNAAKILQSTQIPLSTGTTTTLEEQAPWLEEESNAIKADVSFLYLLSSLAEWCIASSASASSPTNVVLEEKSSELVVEIFNTLYALRMGQYLTSLNDVSSADNDDSNKLSRLVATTLKLQINDTTGTAIISSNFQCQLAVCSLMMDSDASFGVYLLEHHPGAFHSLLRILQHQVHDVVGHAKVSSGATASLVPILVVCTKYAGANEAAQTKIKQYVFPPEREEFFEEKINDLQQQQRSTNGSIGNNNYGKSNMSPLDAPKDTIRGELLQLLSWPESYIKRCSAEFVWILCHGNPTEYVRRVGMGNALPLLHAKGLAKMPTTGVVSLP